MTEPGAMQVDLRRLAQFVAVVEAGSLTDAAARLGVTQQALSAAMRTLEAGVGVELLTRGKGMEPSPAGLRLYDSAQVLLAGAARAVDDARAVDAGLMETVRVGHTPAIDSVNVFDALGDRVPADAGLHLHQMFPQPMIAALLAGEIDVALRRGVRAPRGMCAQVIGFDRLNVAFRAGEAPSATQVRLPDLRGRRLILWAPESRSQYSAFLAAQCRRSGFEPEVEVNRFQGVAPIAAPLTTTGVFALVTQSPGRYLDGRIQVLPLADTVTAPMQALWLPITQTGPAGEVIATLGGAGGVAAEVADLWPRTAVDRPTEPAISS